MILCNTFFVKSYEKLSLDGRKTRCETIITVKKTIDGNHRTALCDTMRETSRARSWNRRKVGRPVVVFAVLCPTRAAAQASKTQDKASGRASRSPASQSVRHLANAPGCHTMRSTKSGDGCGSDRSQTRRNSRELVRFVAFSPVHTVAGRVLASGRQHGQAFDDFGGKADRA